MTSISSNPTVICFGEVLWDMLPGGRAIGGAPLNTAYHLHKLGVNTGLVSRVGNDEYGRDIKAFIEKTGLQHAILQQDGDHPTGRVEVKISAEDHDVKYDIVNDAAWDFIEYDYPVKNLAAKAAYLVYGSLIARSKTSGETLLNIIKQPLVKVMDVNLRAPFYSRELLGELIGLADIVKMNETELHLISSWFGYTGDDRERMKGLLSHFNLRICIVTCGGAGAYILHGDELHFEKGRQITVADTIGSGDAFLAGFLSEYICGNTIRQSLHTANLMGAFVAQRTGGCPDYDRQVIKEILGQHE